MANNNLVLIFFIFIVYLCAESLTEINYSQLLHRNKRGVVFPSSSTIGIFIAIAVPLDLPNRNVFMSYNFEANYNLPYLGSDVIPGPLTKFIPAEDLPEARKNINDDDIEISLDENNSTTVKNETIIQRDKRNTLKSVISRASIYKMLKGKLKSFGMNGKECLLKLICETNSANLHQENGVLGNIFHIIFTPSSSSFENLSDDYYLAEINGLESRCDLYNEKCPQNVLDFITETFNIY